MGAAAWLSARHFRFGAAPWPCSAPPRGPRRGRPPESCPRASRRPGSRAHFTLARLTSVSETGACHFTCMLNKVYLSRVPPSPKAQFSHGRDSPNFFPSGPGLRPILRPAATRSPSSRWTGSSASSRAGPATRWGVLGGAGRGAV